MNTPEQPSPSAQEAFEQHYDEIRDTLAAIRHQLDWYHNDGTPKTWADVGSLEHVKEELHSIAEFLGA